MRDVPFIARDSFDFKNKDQMSALLKDGPNGSFGEVSKGGCVELEMGPLSGSNEHPSEKQTGIMSEPDQKDLKHPRSIIKPISPLN